MKLLIKHVDNLKSVVYPDRETIPQYLIYKMTDDGVKVGCMIVNGDSMKNLNVEMIKLQYHLENYNDDFTLDVEYVSYEEHKKEINQI